MKVEEIARDAVMFVGDDHESVATAFLDGGAALLVDSLGSRTDAAALQHTLDNAFGARVHMIACTHFMSDHMAGLAQFADARLIAHRQHRYTFLSQNHREDAFWREPDIVHDGMTLRWGRHELRLIPNPGRTMDHVSIDVPSADLVCAGDNIVGNIAYVSRTDPRLLRGAIERVRRLGRGTVIGGHMGRFPANVLSNAIHYLDALQGIVVGIRNRVEPRHVAARIAAIPVEQCLAAGVEAALFERQWHAHNLDAIVAQQIFALDGALALREARA